MIARLELVRLWRSRRPWIAAGALVLFLVLMLLGFYTYAQSKTHGAARFEATFENRSYFNGLTFALYAFYFGFVLLLPVFVATEGGAQIAGDTANGTLGLVLARPVSKARVFFTKLALAAAWCFALTGLFLGTALVVGLVAVGWGELALYPGVLQMTDRRSTSSSTKPCSASSSFGPRRACRSSLRSRSACGSRRGRRAPSTPSVSRSRSTSSST